MCLRGRFDRLANQSPVWTLASNPNTYETPMRQQQTALSATKTEQMEADLTFRLNCLALCFQDPDVHRFFVPGEKWIACSHSLKSLKGAVSLPEIIGVSNQDFEKIYGRQWKSKVRNGHHPFGFFRIHEYNNRDYVTAKVSNQFSEYGCDESITPDTKTIVMDVINSRAVKKLTAGIESLSRVRSAAIRVNESSKPTALTSKPSVPVPEINEPPASAATSPITEVSPATTAPRTSSVVGAAAMAPSVTPIAPSPSMSTEDMLVKITEDLKGLNLSNEKDFHKALEKVGRHAGFELMTYLDNAQESYPKGEVHLTRSTGGTPATYIKSQRPSQGGSSKRTIQRIRKRTKSQLDNTTKDLDDATRDKVISAVYSDSVLNPLFKYIGGNKRMLIVLDEQQQGELQATGGMTDRAFKAFDDLLTQLTGLSVRERESTLKKLTEGSMPSFTVSDVEVSIKGKKVKRQMMVVDRITDVMATRIVSLIEDDLLIPTSQKTDLDDDNLLIRLMADKGGTFMASKIGLTVMNCKSPNSVESFDLFASLNAPDSYQNWKVLLSKYKEELDFYYDTNKPPNMLLIKYREKIVGTFVYNIDGGSIRYCMERERDSE